MSNVNDPCSVCDKRRVMYCSWCGEPRCEDHYLDEEDGNYCKQECADKERASIAAVPHD